MNQRLRVLRHMFKLSVGAGPAVATIVIVVIILQGASTALLAVAQRRIVNSADLGVTSGLIAAITLGALAAGVGAAGNRIQNNLRHHLAQLVDLTLTQDVLAATTRTPTVEHLERADYLNRLTTLRRGIWELAASCWSVVETAVAIVSLGVSIWLLASISPWLSVLGLLGVPPLLSGRRGQKVVQRARDDCAENIRHEQLLHELCFRPEPAKEVRIAGNGPELSRRADHLWRSTTRREVRARLDSTFWELGGWSCYAVGFLVAIIVVARLVIDQTATLGDIVLVITLASRLQWQIVTTVNGANQLSAAGHIAEHYLWLLDYAATHQGTGTDAPHHLNDGIRLQNVSFHYPGATTATLRDITLTLPAGSTVGLVGVNGAGKSTLVKLLAGVYRPTTGEITLDGQPLTAIDPAAWSRRLSGTLQDFVKLQSPCRESIGIGDLPRRDDDNAIWTAVERAGAERIIAAMPQRLETVLGRTFDGIDLSQGQWQKVALSRSMMRDQPLLQMLDEPTAALDPQAEHDLYERFMAQARGASARNGAVTVLVSHRFSTLHMASLIVVLDEGRIVEQGSHAELMAADGRYAHLFRLQALGHDQVGSPG